MKKIIYILLISIISSAALVSCTKEEVKPNAGGTGGILPVKE